MFRAKLLRAFVSLALGASLSFAQVKPSPTRELTVSGEVAHPLKLTAADFAKLPHQKLTTKDTEGKTVHF